MAPQDHNKVVSSEPNDAELRFLLLHSEVAEFSLGERKLQESSVQRLAQHQAIQSMLQDLVIQGGGYRVSVYN